jgi:type IV pilus assembly protein PilM
MGLFSFSKNSSFLGVDLGSNSIKIVELKNERGRARLATYGFVEQETDVIRANSKEAEVKVINIIKKICAQAKTSSLKVVSSLPSFSVFSSIISLPKMEKNDLAQAVQWEAKKFVPLPLEEMVLDWKVIQNKTNKKFEDGLLKKDALAKSASLVKAGEKSNEIDQRGLIKMDGKEQNDVKVKEAVTTDKKSVDDHSYIKILLTAAPKDLVQRYVAIFRGAGLDLVSLETESFALERSLVGADPAAIMIVDIGDISTDIVVVEQGVPLLNRSLDVGGRTLTENIMNSMQIDKSRAEQFKKDIGFAAADGNNIPKIIESAIGPVVNEIRYSLDLYQQQSGSHKVEKVILAGGSSFLPNLSNYLSKVLNIKVIIGDPWARVIYPLELKSVLSELGPRFAVAIGLAMREIE